jgi:hypothetical protein
MGKQETYKVQRIYRDKPGKRRTLATGLTLEQAQKWCSDPETSSSTCITTSARACTRRNGPWFDSYTKE